MISLGFVLIGIGLVIGYALGGYSLDRWLTSNSWNDGVNGPHKLSKGYYYIVPEQVWSDLKAREGGRDYLIAGKEDDEEDLFTGLEEHDYS